MEEKLSREKLLARLSELDIRRAELSVRRRGGLNREENAEMKLVCAHMREVQRALSALRTEDWRDSTSGQFCFEFKKTAKRMLDRETYEMLVQETVRILRRNHHPLHAYNPKNYE